MRISTTVLIYPVIASIRPTKPPKPQAVATKKPAVTNLEGNKWIIVSLVAYPDQKGLALKFLCFHQENHENNASILIEQTGINQIVNVFNVKSSVIQIKGKVNAISLGASDLFHSIRRAELR